MKKIYEINGIQYEKISTLGSLESIERSLFKPKIGTMRTIHNNVFVLKYITDEYFILPFRYRLSWELLDVIQCESGQSMYEKRKKIKDEFFKSLDNSLM